MPPDRDLDRELRPLGPSIEYPPTPDLARSVRDRLEAEADGAGSPAGSRPQLWWIAAAALVLIVAVPVFAAVLNTVGSPSPAAPLPAGESRKADRRRIKGVQAPARAPPRRWRKTKIRLVVEGRRLRAAQ
jgi:hypothetical protein